MIHSSTSAPDTAKSRQAPPTRDWFLRDSTWADACWVFAPTSALEQERPIHIRWDFTLSGDRHFTSSSHAELLESARRVIALIRTRSLSMGLAQRATSVRIYFIQLRLLVRWMAQEGLTRFADIDSAALLSYRRTIANRRRRDGQRIVPTTVERSVRLLMYLHRYRVEVGDGLTVDPCPGQSAHALVGTRETACGALPHTPDLIAVPLVQGAIEFLETSTIDILCARERYTTAYQQAHRRGFRRNARRCAALRAVRASPFRTPNATITLGSLADLGVLIDLLYIACFVVISYLVGPRVSEILALRAGCVSPLETDEPSSTSGIAVIVGSIFKLETGYHGRPHKWVAPPPAVYAVSVLEALSGPHRQRTGRQELWLRPRNRRLGASEWRPDTVSPLWIPGTGRINQGLARLAAWLALPMHQAKCWKLSTHQGRKTFARFVALRDRTGLFALAQHLGHRDRTVTDAGYVGTDYALTEDIEAHILEESVSAWEHMLSTPELGGRAGAEILAKRPRFRGARMKQDLRSYARLLVEAGLTLGVCDWGFCVYRQEHSACLGTASAPNPIRREPSTCSRCRNFVVAAKHKPYWQEQVRRHEALLNEPALPRQTLQIARERLTEAITILRSIDSSSKDD
jgi:integrase